MKIEVLVGMVASGKSTYARQRAREGALIVSHDDLTEMLHGEYRYESGLRDCYRGMESHIAMQAILAGRDVIVDRTHLTRESRARWVEFSRTANAMGAPDNQPLTEVVAVVFPVELPWVHANRRHQDDSRGRTYGAWLEVANHHHCQSSAEPICDDEGFSAIVYL